MIKLQKLRKEKTVKTTAATIASITTVVIIAFSTLLVLFAGPTVLYLLMLNRQIPSIPRK